MAITMLSWNVNGIRAVLRKGFVEWLQGESPDIFCAQETKIQQAQLGDSMLALPDYHAYWNWAQRKGYSGVAILSKEEPLSVETGFGTERFDSEGRVIIAQYPQFTLLNIYFPNGKSGPERLDYKMAFYDAFLAYADGLRAQGRRLVVCGDYNTAHTEMDLARPKENEKFSGFLPMERAWMDTYEAHGYVDTFRRFNQEPGHYSWWDYKTGARERNVGWRIDYVYVSSDLAASVTRAFIMPEVMGSDHCPVGVELEV